MQGGTKEELIYIAGFFDGDGCVSTSGRRLRVSITNTVRDPLVLVHRFFGGSINEHQRRGNRQLIYIWIACGTDAEDFLKYVLPYLIIKKRVAILGLEFQTIPYSSSNSKKDSIVDEMHKLNKRGKEEFVTVNDILKKMEDNPKTALR